MNTQATVEVLTAEVRTLMVGSRQITQSVVKQLDHVDLELCEPFGRIRLGDDARLVVGRHRDTGVLVVARFNTSRRPAYVWEDDFDGANRPIVCSAERTIDGEYHLRYDDRQIRLEESAAKECGEHSRYGTAGICGHWNVNGCDQTIKAAISRSDAINDLHVNAAALPLIVLAGLR